MIRHVTVFNQLLSQFDFSDKGVFLLPLPHKHTAYTLMFQVTLGSFLRQILIDRVL